MDATQDTEITLGTGKLLGIFFVVVIVCAAFFTLGYLFGRGSVSSGSTTSVSGVPTGGGPGAKPSAGGSKTPDNQNCPAGATNCTQAANGPDPSFFSPVSTKQPAATPAPATQPGFTTPDANAGSSPDSKINAAGSYMVQVAAVSRQEDADILVNALRKKQYPVFVAANLPGDSLFHVQVGPFSDPKDAEAMRSRLAGDGYNAIVKK